MKRDGKTLNNKEERYVLSLKDLCTLDILPELVEAGIYSMKIEGRMKSPRYTAGVVSIYRKYVDLYLEKGGKATASRRKTGRGCWTFSTRADRRRGTTSDATDAIWWL